MARHRRSSGVHGSWIFGTPTSTFLHSTIFVARLTTDTRAKFNRNKQWEEAFAQLRDALGRPPATEAHENPHLNSTHSIDSRAKDSAEGVAQHATSTKLEEHSDALRQDASQLDGAARLWDDIRWDSRMPGAQKLAWPANTGRDLVPHNLPPQSLWAPDVLRWSSLRKRHTQKKLVTQGLSMGLLVNHLIRQADLARYLKSAQGELAKLSPVVHHVASLNDDQAKAVRAELLSDIERLDLTHVSDDEAIARQRDHAVERGVPSYGQDNDGDFYTICKQMNTSIAKLLRECGPSDRDESITVAKICHNLLVSTAAPDLQTFNILIHGLPKLRHYKLVNNVFAAFDTCKIRPNELACRLILDRYATQNRPDDFSRFVAKMRGVGDALSLAKPTTVINEASEGRLIRVNEGKVYQKVYPTPMVFAALVDGVLRFAGFDRALDVYYEMKTDGWGLAISGLTRLLADCVRRADWEGGTYIWEEINLIKTASTRSSVARAYHTMLSLCSVTGNTVAFNQVLTEVAKRGFDQKTIIERAMETTHWARYKEDSIAPAWAADNLMIAVSGYVEDARSSNATSDEPLPDELEYGDEPFTQAQVEDLADLDTPSNTRAPVEDKVVDPKEAWSKWVELEFGEKPKDPEP